MEDFSEIIVGDNVITVVNKGEDLPFDDSVTFRDAGHLGLKILSVDNTDLSVVTTFVNKEDIGKLIKFLQEVENG